MLGLKQGITMSGQEEHRFDISNISSADPCVVTTSTDHDFSTFDFVRIMDIDGRMPTPRGVDQIDGKRFRVIVLDTTNFAIQDPITFENIDSTNFTPYVTGGNVNLVETTFVYSS